MRAPPLALVAAAALVQAYGNHLGSFVLLSADNGKFTGAGYADLHYRLFAINAQAVLLLVVALACLIPIWRGKGFQWPAFAAAGWLAAGCGRLGGHWAPRGTACGCG